MLGVLETHCQFGARRSDVASSRKFVPVAGHERVTLFPLRWMLNECGICQSASLFDGLPPTTVNRPPRINSEPVLTSASGGLSAVPLPKGDQVFPSHFATPRALTPPMERNGPPT